MRESEIKKSNTKLCKGKTMYRNTYRCRQK